jgi:catechol 2,3-dioxygenase-like lactoylglutathione lyase family enzyme
MARIKHMAIFSDDPEELAKFYVEVFGMELKGRSSGTDGSVWLSDGYMDIALLRRRSDLAPHGLHHFGITLNQDEEAGVKERLKERDTWISTPPPGRPYVEVAAKDSDGNKFDISTSAVVSSGDKVAMKDEERVKEFEKA